MELKMNNKTEILFLGRLFSKANENKIRSKCLLDMQDAANVLQWNIIDGFVENDVSKVDVVSYLPVDSWPKYYKDCVIKEETHTISENIIFHQCGFCNITKIKQLLNNKVCNKFVLEWLKKTNSNRKIVVCYSCNNVLMKAVAAAKKKDKSVITVQVIADITEFAANAGSHFLRDLYTKMQIKKNEQLQ